MNDISSLLNVTSDYVKSTITKDEKVSRNANQSFDSVFQSAMDMIQETNQLSNNADLEKIKFLTGESETTHDLSIALAKAETALQYTVAFRDKVLDAYKEIMNMQF